MLNGNLKENLQKLSQISSQGAAYNQCLSNVNNENSHLSMNPEYLSSFSDLENIRELMLNAHGATGEREQGQVMPAGNSGIGAIELEVQIKMLELQSQQNMNAHPSSSLLNDSLQAVRDFHLPSEDRDSIYDILLKFKDASPHNVRKCLEESKQRQGSQETRKATNSNLVRPSGQIANQVSMQYQANSSAGGTGIPRDTTSFIQGKYNKDHNRSFEIDQNELMRAMNFCESRQKGV